MGAQMMVCPECGSSFGGKQPCGCPNAKPMNLRACPYCSVYSAAPEQCDCRNKYARLPTYQAVSPPPSSTKADSDGGGA